MDKFEELMDEYLINISDQLSKAVTNADKTYLTGLYDAIAVIKTKYREIKKAHEGAHKNSIEL